MILTFERAFDAAHFLPGHKGKCRHLHGHTWRVIIQIDAQPRGDMIVDFNDLKAIVDEFDHRILNKCPPMFDVIYIPPKPELPVCTDREQLDAAAKSAFKTYTDKVKTFRDEMFSFMKWGWFDYPSAENIAKDIHKRVTHLLGDLGYIEKKQAHVIIEVWESDNSSVSCDDHESP